MFPDFTQPANPHGNSSGWVLTGGRSSRMGQDKALVEIDGIPLAMRISCQVAAVCGTVALVGDPETYAHLGLPVIPDSYPGQGPLAGIEAALGASATDVNLIVACDMPELGPEIFERLFRALANHDCAVPRYPDGKLEPLCAVYSRRCHARIRATLETGVRRVTDALRSLAVSYLPVEHRGAFRNLNTPEELRDYVDTRHRGGRPNG